MTNSCIFGYNQKGDIPEQLKKDLERGDKQNDYEKTKSIFRFINNDNRI